MDVVKHQLKYKAAIEGITKIAFLTLKIDRRNVIKFYDRLRVTGHYDLEFAKLY